ncbi:hypothetical protein [Oceanobacillus sp. J11TS1]|uniref:hypothetical protein n=1 Tax=Oceanobacillus sp. J11TS1 TaxID=2807191 RepID=UPI001B00D0D9|nr:hypothetical protein [Oceanobacillus sp. J11TS1]GIO24139.1 hypothetical protein J11TS1_27200 [Oceanobacillus sp. J11TS1]
MIKTDTAKRSIKSSFFTKKSGTSIPKIPNAKHTSELFKKSDRAIKHLKTKEKVSS